MSDLREQVKSIFACWVEGHMAFHEAVDAILALWEKERGGCPCLYTTPCSDQCTCAHPHMSGGCSRCCKYGSDEQRKANAERLVVASRAEKAEAETARLREALEEIRDSKTKSVAKLCDAARFALSAEPVGEAMEAEKRGGA